MDNLELWWSGLDTLNKVLWGCSITSTLLFVGAWIMSMIGGDTDMDTDTDTNADGLDSGFMGFILSFKSILAFFLGASWTGLAASNQGWSTAAVVAIAIGTGLVTMVIIASLFYMLLKLQQNSSLKMDNTIGCKGEVYLSLPANRKSGGQVEILVNNSYKTFRAICNNDTPIKSGEKIVVLDVLEDNVLLVDRVPIIDDIDNKINEINNL
ncbi:MAG: hypothetical protein MJZ61_04165 [Bacteroidales bacterium]|nr:hypothetical protein [Bacteroidales bacterium]